MKKNAIWAISLSRNVLYSVSSGLVKANDLDSLQEINQLKLKP